jgi:hypothetical protein
MAKYKHKFDRVTFTNKWTYHRSLRHWGDYTLIGLSKFWFSSYEYEWRLCLFGLELRIWMKRELIKNN